MDDAVRNTVNDDAADWAMPYTGSEIGDKVNCHRNSGKHQRVHHLVLEVATQLFPLSRRLRDHQMPNFAIGPSIF